MYLNLCGHLDVFNKAHFASTEKTINTLFVILQKSVQYTNSNVTAVTVPVTLDDE